MKEQIKSLMLLGVSAAKIAEPIHRSTISKWLKGERELSSKNEKIIKQALQKFKQNVNDILKDY